MSAPAIVPMTELEAVNTMLSVIDEAPVNSLEVPGITSAALARNVLYEQTREFQTRGYKFNTEKDYLLVRDASGFIVLPANILQAKPSGSDALAKAGIRGNRLYDLENHTYVWTRDLRCTIVVALPFDEMPSPARGYVAIAAARKFQKRVLGSDSLNRFTQEDELTALITFRDAEGEAAAFNVFTDSQSVSDVWALRSLNGLVVN